MSTRDREILKEAKLSQRKVADLFGITLQGVNRGISAETDYLTTERLGKLVDLLQPIDAETSKTLRSSLHKIMASSESSGVKSSNTSYVQLNTLTDILQREKEDLIWMPIDPLTRLLEEVDCLRDYIKSVEQRLVIVTCEPIEDLRAILDERVYQFDFQNSLKGQIVVIQSETASFTPEMLLGSKAVFVKTVFGFQMIRENELNIILKRFFKQTKISPNYLPARLRDGYSKALQYSCYPTARALAYFLHEATDISPELTKYLTSVLPEYEKFNSEHVSAGWTDLEKLVADIAVTCGKNDADLFVNRIEQLKRKNT
jgi:transcriptional regulator with XRE-family HTH domain